MKDEDKLIDAIIDLHQEIVLMRKDNNLRLERLEKQLKISNERLDKVEDQLIKNNKATGELRLSVMKLAERDKVLQEHDRRIRKIETILLKK